MFNWINALKLDWQNKESVQQKISDKRISPFLFNEGSLTYYIQQHCKGEFNLELVSESWQAAMSDEIALLSLSDNEKTFIRKVRLKCDNQALVYARTVIPEKTFSGKNKKLSCLGTNPLADILFKDENTYRADMCYAKITVDCGLYKEATKDLDIISELWGRQSLFYTEQQPLLITEIFLPSILECNKN
ncbi:MAG: chorismate lyase [Proteobacteria bacterium]|nr:chorismate lyase [Pseudomonadota bacterium]NOG61705.1 chorismate lyase [Pseudomonadota bacterium]